MFLWPLLYQGLEVLRELGPKGDDTAKILMCMGGERPFCFSDEWQQESRHGIRAPGHQPEREGGTGFGKSLVQSFTWLEQFATASQTEEKMQCTPVLLRLPVWWAQQVLCLHSTPGTSASFKGCSSQAPAPFPLLLSNPAEDTLLVIKITFPW